LRAGRPAMSRASPLPSMAHRGRRRCRSAFCC
jgi:hypothetical protein